MLISTDTLDKCILCCSATPNSEEHIFPACIGGHFRAKILCQTCNSICGIKLVPMIQKDSWYLTALEWLRNELTELYNSTPRKYLGRIGDDNYFEIITNDGKISVRTKQLPDGTIVADESNAKPLAGMLRKAGLPQNEIDFHVKEYLDISPGSARIFPANIYVRKKTGPELIPNFGKAPLCDYAALLIAYEFLALLLGHAIYAQEFDCLRETIKDSAIHGNRIRIEPLFARTAKPYHQIDFQQSGFDLLITIRFLAASAYQITLSNFGYKIPDICFIEDLKYKKSLLAMSHLDARNGNFKLLDNYHIK